MAKMCSSSHSLFIKKIDMVHANHEETIILPPPDPGKCGQVINSTRDQRQDRRERRRGYVHHRDRIIEPVPVPPKQTSVYEEMLRRAKLRKLESRDRRLQEFQNKKKLLYERKKAENEQKRKQFLENRERVKREEAARIMERDRRRREDRLFDKNNARVYRQQIVKTAVDLNSGSFQKPGRMRYENGQQTLGVNASESTISLYGVEKGKVCESRTDLEPHKFRIYLPPNKMKKSVRPRIQPYHGSPNLRDQITPCDRPFAGRPAKRADRALQEHTSSNLAKHSFDGSTIYARIKRAEEAAQLRQDKKTISYKLSHSKLYAPSKLPVRHNRSTSTSQKKFFDACDCGNRLVASHFNTHNYNSNQHDDPCDQNFHFIRVYTGKRSSYRKEADGLADVPTSAPKTSSTKRELDQKACKSDLNDDVDNLCPLSTTTSIVRTNESKTSIKSASCSRTTSPEEAAPPETHQRGIPVNKASITSKQSQTNPIDRTSTSVQCPDSYWSEEDRLGPDDHYSETFMCEETSLTGLISATSDLADVQTECDKKNVEVTQTATNTPEQSKDEMIEEIVRSESITNQPEVVYLPCFYQPRVSNFSTGYSLNQGFDFVPLGHLNNNQEQFVVVDPSFDNQNPAFHSYDGYNQAQSVPTNLTVQHGESQYVIMNSDSTDTANIHCNMHYVQRIPFMSRSPQLSPELRILVQREASNEIIVVCDPGVETSQMGAGNNEILEVNPLPQIEHDPLYEDCESQMIENEEDQNHLQQPDKLPNMSISKNTKLSSSNEQANISGPCMHVRQVDLSFKDKDDTHSNYGRVVSTKEDLDNNTEIRAGKPFSKQETYQMYDRKADDPSGYNKGPSHPNKKEDSFRNSSAKSQPSTSADEESCKSLDIKIDTYLINSVTKGASPAASDAGQAIAHGSTEARLPKSSHGNEVASDRNAYNAKSNDLVSIPEDHVMPPIYLSRDQAHSESDSSGDRSAPAFKSNKSNNNRRVNFSLPLGKTGSKRIQAEVICTCCSHSDKASGKSNQSWNDDTGNPSNDPGGSSRRYQPSTSSSNKRLYKCADNDPACHMRRPHPRAFRKTYKSEFRTSSSKIYQRKAGLDVVKEEQIGRDDENCSHSDSSRQFRSDVGGVDNVPIKVPSVVRNVGKKGGQKGIIKRNHDRTPRRKAKKTKKTRKVQLRNAKSKHVKKESSTVLGLYEQNQFSIVSLYRKSSQLKARWKSKLYDIKKRYSHILTSTSSSGLNRRSLDILLPESASFVPKNNPLMERNCSTISLCGSMRDVHHNWDQHRSVESSEYHHQDQDVIDCENNLHQRETEDFSKTGDRDDQASEIFAEACRLVFPASFKSILTKVYYETRKDLFRRKSSSIDGSGYDHRQYSGKSRQRGGMNHVPIYLNVQIQMLIRGLAVLYHFHKAVDLVENQIKSTDEYDTLIKHYLSCEITKKVNAMLEDIIERLYDKLDQCNENPKRINQLKSENVFLKEVIYCLRRVKHKVLQDKHHKLSVDLPVEMRLVLDKQLEDLEAFILRELDELCQDINSETTLQDIYIVHKVPIWLQDALYYLGSVDHPHSHRNKEDFGKCPIDIMILSSTLAKHLMNQLFYVDKQI